MSFESDKYPILSDELVASRSAVHAFDVRVTQSCNRGRLISGCRSKGSSRSMTQSCRVDKYLNSCVPTVTSITRVERPNAKCVRIQCCSLTVSALRSRAFPLDSHNHRNFLPVDQIFPATHSHDTSNKGSGVPCRSVTRRPRRRTPHAARVIVSISDCRRPGHHWTSVESGPLPTVIRYHEPTAARHKISMDRAPATQNLPVIVTGTRQVLDASMAADKV